MQIFLFFALFIAILAIIFAVQNNETTTVSFFLWDTNGSLALVLLIAMAAGALISYLASLPSNIKTRLAVRNLRKKVEELEITLEKNRQIIEDSKMEEKSTKPEQSLINDQEGPA